MLKALLTSRSRLSRVRHQQLLDTIAEKRFMRDMQLSAFPSGEVAVRQGLRQALYPSPFGTNHDSVHSPEGSPTSRLSIQKSMVTPTLWTKRSLGHFPQEWFFGSLEIKSWLHLQQTDSTGGPPTDYSKAPFEYQTWITFRPANWLVKLGAKHGFHAYLAESSTQGWQHHLKTFCPVPNDAPIFQLCSTGNLAAVRDMLSGGHASVRDTDSLGRTPLHVSGLGLFIPKSSSRLWSFLAH